MGIHRPEWLEQVEGVLATLNEGVIVSHDGARILSVNSRFEGMIGIPRAETRKGPPSDDVSLVLVEVN